MYIGLDLGTSGLRAVLVADDGRLIASGAESYATQQPHPGWSEQDPGLWTSAVDAVLSQMAAQHPSAMAQVRGMGVSGHMHGAVCLDTRGAILRPCILWNDSRAGVEAAELDARQGVRETSGNIVFPGFTAPKLMWMARHEPQLFEACAKVLLPAGYMNFHLTGEYFADMSDAAGTAWLDTGGRDWSETLLDACGLTRAQMPRLIEGCEVGGTLRPDLAARWGMSDQVAVVGGAGDNAASACGVGALGEGTGFVSLGTSGVVLTGRDSYAPAPASAVHSFCHAVPDRWYQMGVILSATDSLNWLSRVTGAAPATLAKDLPDQINGPGRLRFMPYLSGERTPHNDPQVRGGFLNIEQGTDRAAMTQAVMEGVAFALGDCAQALRGTGAQLNSLLAIGGGTASRYWLQTIATVLDVTLELPEAGDFGAALGAARLAMVGTGAGSVEDIMQPPKVAERIAPRSDLVAAYREAHAAFAACYPMLREVS